MKNHLFLISIALCATFSFSEKETGGILYQDTRWNAEDGPFRITSDLLVPQGIRLTITPGTVIMIKKAIVDDTVTRQIDNNDSSMVSIKIEGTLNCVGKSDKRIVFFSDTLNRGRCTWYGIVLNKVEKQFTEIAFTDISGAYCGITVAACTPVIRNTLIEFNHNGIICADHGSASIFNCIIAYNRNVGIRTSTSNPRFTNNIIVYNSNNGIWCDGMSVVSLTYNCLFGNKDGNAIECDPDIGRAVAINKHGDSIDVSNNILCDPIFSGSVADSAAAEKDLTLPTEKRSIKNLLIAAIIHRDRNNETSQEPSREKRRYYLSKYSPCINAGDPAKKFMDKDGSRNDLGIYGGPDYFEE